MQSHQFQALLSLVHHDQTMLSLQKSIQSLVVQKEEKQALLDAVQSKVHESRVQLHDAIKDFHAAEHDLESVYVKEDHVQKQLENVQDYTQYQALSKELQILQQEKDGQEKDLMQIMNKKLTHEKNVIQLEQESSAQSQELLHAIQELEKESAQLNTQYEQAQKERVQKASLVPQEWMEMYVSMSASVQNPIVPIMNESCGGCFYPLTQVLLQQAMKHKLVQCQNCCRMMYISQ